MLFVEHLHRRSKLDREGISPSHLVVFATKAALRYGKGVA